MKEFKLTDQAGELVVGNVYKCEPIKIEGDENQVKVHYQKEQSKGDKKVMVDFSINYSDSQFSKLFAAVDKNGLSAADHKSASEVKKAAEKRLRGAVQGILDLGYSKKEIAAILKEASEG